MTTWRVLCTSRHWCLCHWCSSSSEHWSTCGFSWNLFCIERVWCIFSQSLIFSTYIIRRIGLCFDDLFFKYPQWWGITFLLSSFFQSLPAMNVFFQYWDTSSAFSRLSTSNNCRISCPMQLNNRRSANVKEHYVTATKSFDLNCNNTYPAVRQLCPCIRLQRTFCLLNYLKDDNEKNFLFSQKQ